jgi:hypothetical protein
MESGGHDLILTVAAAVLVIAGTGFLLLAARARRSTDRRPAFARNRLARPTHLGLIVMGGLSACAGIVHLAAAPGHYAELGDLGAGFLGAGIFQLAWARTAIASRHGALSPLASWLGLLGNAAIIGAWAVARTVGVPFGHVDPIALPDGAATTLEALVVGGLAITLGPSSLRRALTGRPFRAIAPIAVVPILGLALVVTALATVAIAAGADHGLPSGAGQHAIVDHR